MLLLSFIKVHLEIYDYKKGFLRRLFGDDQTIKTLRKFYNELQQAKIQNTEQQKLDLLTILKSKNTANPRLSGYVIKTLRSAVEKNYNLLTSTRPSLAIKPINSLIALSIEHGISLNEINIITLVKANKLKLTLILNHLNTILKGQLTKPLILAVLNHPNWNELNHMTKTLEWMNLPLNEQHLIALISQSNLYSDESVLHLLTISRNHFTSATIDGMISIGTQGSPHNRLLAIIGFLNNLISLFQRTANQLAQPTPKIINKKGPHDFRLPNNPYSRPYDSLKEVYFPSRIKLFFSPIKNTEPLFENVPQPTYSY